MNITQEEQLDGVVVEEQGRGQVCRELVGGPCRYCGRTGQKTQFCGVCGAVLCWTCLNGTACDVRAPDGYMWSHGRAMRARREERERIGLVGRAANAGGGVAPPPACVVASRGAPGAHGKDGDVVAAPEPFDEDKAFGAWSQERERLSRLRGDEQFGEPT